MFCAENLSKYLEFLNLRRIWNEEIYIEVVNFLFCMSVSAVDLCERSLNLHVLHVALRQYAMFV